MGDFHASFSSPRDLDEAREREDLSLRMVDLDDSFSFPRDLGEARE